MPPALKTSALCLSILGTLIALELATLANKEPLPAGPLQTFSLQLGFFPLIIHRLVPRSVFFLSQNAANQALDLAWLEKLPNTIATTQLIGASFTNKAQTGLIKIYLRLFFFFIILLSLFAVYCHNYL